MQTTTLDDREPGGFYVADYSENPAGNVVLRPTTPQAAGRYVEARRFSNPNLRVERAYLPASE